MTLALIDGDGLAYAAALASEGTSAAQAAFETHRIIENLNIAINTETYYVYLTGKTNFRYTVYPEYKAHRKEKPKPQFLQECREVLITHYGAEVSEDCEADDLIAIEHTKQQYDSLIVSVDKDFDQLPGWHYNPRKAERYLLTPNDATRFFYYQLLVGDSADNIKGVAKVGPIKANKLLAQGSNEQEWFQLVRDAYGLDEEMSMNAKCLWLQREKGQIWTWPEWASPMEHELDTSTT